VAELHGRLGVVAHHVSAGLLRQEFDVIFQSGKPANQGIVIQLERLQLSLALGQASEIFVQTFALDIAVPADGLQRALTLGRLFEIEVKSLKDFHQSLEERQQQAA
jgi:hypothetical protein